MVKDASDRSETSSGFTAWVVLAPLADRLELAAAEAFESGAAGLEEREGEVIFYVPSGSAERVRACLVAHDLAPTERRVPAADWAEAWKAGLVAIDVSDRLRIRPSFVPGRAPTGQAELVIDPGQACGTGGHESTRLALEWIDALAPLPRSARVLDVGSGTGVLALSALRLGAARAVAFDTDPDATLATRENAGVNGLLDRVDTFTGEITAIRAEAFDLVVANLLRSEMFPHLGAMAARAGAGARLVLSGLLGTDREPTHCALTEVGLRARAERTRTDASGTEWLALLASR